MRRTAFARFVVSERRQAVGGDERERQSLLAFSSLPHHGDSKVVLAASESWRRLEWYDSQPEERHHFAVHWPIVG